MTTPLSSLSCPPRFSTPRRPERPTLGPRVGYIANQLDTPLMPWQQHVANVALEVDPATGLLAYREVVLTVPRQSGKTTLLLAAMVHRALGYGQRQRILYTAQTRGAARLKWEDEHVAALERSRFRHKFKVRKQLGAEGIHWKNGSRHGISSNTEKAAHGETLDMGVIDEAFAQEDDRLEQAFKPAMITRAQPQMWVLSTAGNAKSTYLRGKVDDGRARAHLTDSICYFEWSAPPGADPADPATWWACMPALGYTVTEDAVRANYESMKPAEFRRAFLNHWPDDAPDEWLVIPQPAWTDLVDRTSQIVGPMAICADVTPNRSAGSIAVAGRDAAGLLLVEIIEARSGTSWMSERLIELNEKWDPCALVIDAAGPAGSLIAALNAAGIDVVSPSGREVGQACGQLYDAVVPPADAPAEWSAMLRHRGQAELNAALAGAQKRPLGDAWAWARKGLNVDISPLVAVTLAAWGHATRSHIIKQAAIEPFVIF